MGVRPAAREDGERWVIYCTSGFVGLLLVFAGYSIYLVVTEPPPPWYSVTVGAVSGLDPAMVDPRGALDPAFNLTLRIDATLSAKDKGPYCLERATSVEVSYLGVPLAVGRAPEPGEGTCADAGQQRDLAVVARARGVVVPGFLLDSLADDVRRGEAVFEVTLMSPRVGEGDSDGDWKEMTCWGKVGDDASLETPCVKSSVDAGLPRRCPGLPAASPVRCSGRRSTSR